MKILNLKVNSSDFEKFLSLAKKVSRNRERILHRRRRGAHGPTVSRGAIRERSPGDLRPGRPTMAFSWDAQSLRAAIDDPQRSLAALRVANQGSGRHELTGAEAVAFFTGSGLPQETLSSIWMASTKGAPEMGPQMFLEALKLAYAVLHGGNPSSSSGAASGLSQSPGGPASFSSHGGVGGGDLPDVRAG